MDEPCRHEDAWLERRVLDLLGVELPILQAPMARAQGSALAIAMSEMGGLGSLPCAILSPVRVREEVAAIRAATSRPYGLNVFATARRGGIVAALALGASAVQIGTAYLLCPESTILDVHRHALKNVAYDGTVLSNVFSGGPARGIVNRLVRETGPMSVLVPEFPLASTAVAPLRAASEAAGSSDFAQMSAGQAAPLARDVPAGGLTRELAECLFELFGRLSR